MTEPAATEQPRTGKKAKPSPPVEDFKYTGALLVLRRLQDQWNVLDGDGEYLEYLCSNGPERRDCLHDMDEIIKDDMISYQNPFGADDRENFADTFDRLTKAEQKAFRARAQTCLDENRRFLDSDLNELLLSVKPQEPFFISLDPETDESVANGTERFPFASVHQAERALSGSSEVKLLECAPSCEKKKCHRCPKMVCTTHGDGFGETYSDGETLWEFSKCIECNETVGCSQHRFPECSVCRNGTDGEMALGMHDFPGQFDLCKKCAKICKKTVDMEEDEEKHGTTCGFRCCSECINNHRCGDVPSDYI